MLAAPGWTPSLGPDGSGEPDWIAIGLVLSLVGSFLLGNAILFRHPRALVEEFFGSRATRLGAIREFVFHRAQVAVGFTYLVGGFGLQILGRFRPIPPSSDRAFPIAWIGGVIVLTITLLALSWWWAKHAFRRHVRAHFRKSPPDFEADLRLAREVGDLFGVDSQADDTVQSFLERLHHALELRPPERKGRREIPLGSVEELETEESS
jgi:hypothetical protein